MINADEFEAQLQRDGYLDIKHRQLERGQDTEPHSHAFDTRLLVQQGQMTVVCAGSAQTYRTGDVLEISAGVEHGERYNAEPLHFVAGLRHKVCKPE